MDTPREALICITEGPLDLELTELTDSSLHALLQYIATGGVKASYFTPKNRTHVDQRADQTTTCFANFKMLIRATVYSILDKNKTLKTCNSMQHA